MRKRLGVGHHNRAGGKSHALLDRENGPVFPTLSLQSMVQYHGSGNHAIGRNFWEREAAAVAIKSHTLLTTDSSKGGEGGVRKT